MKKISITDDALKSCGIVVDLSVFVGVDRAALRLGQVEEGAGVERVANLVVVGGGGNSYAQVPVRIG